MSAYSLQELLALNGHGVYVWSALALCAAAIALETLGLRQARRRALQRVLRLHRSPQRSKS